MAAVLLSGLVLFLGLRPTTGELLITVSGPRGEPSGVEVFVDGERRCSGTPCRVGELEEGAHLIKAGAAGLAATADRVVSVRAGRTATQAISLEPVRSGAGLKVLAEGENLTVSLDGRNLGAPPVSVDNVEPGSHVVRVEGEGATYAPLEQTVDISAGEVRTLGPLRLEVRQARLTLELDDGAEDAAVTVDGEPVPELPTTLALDARESHEVVAEKRGYRLFRQHVAFDPGKAEKTLVIELQPDQSSSRSSSPGRVRRPPRRSTPARARSRAAKLNINSIPVAHVVVDGRPLGSTPLTNVSVPGGPHTVVFIHPTLGRKVASATVAPGQAATVAVKF